MKHNFINLQHREPTTAAAAAIGAGITALSTGGQIYAAGKMNKKTRQWNEKMYGIQRRDALSDWERQNLYNSPAEQMKRLKEAGLNPALMYGEGSGGAGQSMAVRNSEMKSWNPQVPDIGGMGAQLGMQAAMMKAQIDNLNADTKDKLANIPNKEATTPNIMADTEVKKMTKVIAEFTGKELKDVYEKINVPNRGQQEKTISDEYGARQAIADNLYEQWTNGNLSKKSNAEVERELLNNAKTREETKNIIKTFDLLEENIKGQQLNNAFGELDLKLQKETGLGKDSPGWSKLFARVIQMLMNKL